MWPLFLMKNKAVVFVGLCDIGLGMWLSSGGSGVYPQQHIPVMLAFGKMTEEAQTFRIILRGEPHEPLSPSLNKPRRFCGAVFLDCPGLLDHVLPSRDRSKGQYRHCVIPQVLLHCSALSMCLISGLFRGSFVSLGNCKAFSRVSDFLIPTGVFL